MEIHGTDGSITQLKPNTTTIFGRQNLSNTKDSTVSRNHISFDLSSSPNSPNNQTNSRVLFQVIGKNPVWVYSKDCGKKFETLKKFQKGELGIDDLFCVSGKNPVWFSLKEVNEVKDGVLGEIEEESLDLGGGFGGELSESLEGNFGGDDVGEFGLDFVDVSDVDPVQEFGFLVIGHEFDQYPKSMIREIKNWDWFLDDPIRGSDDEGSGETRRKKGGLRKRKKTSGHDDVDEEWSADSDSEVLTTKAPKVGGTKYHTRSRDSRKSDNKRTNKNIPSRSSSKKEDEEEDVDEDEEDETLGGFVVDDVEEEDDENDIDDDEEEEFVEDEDADEMEE
ncbi:uncharacterized protein LOC141591684 [Silene latifolia]|uniref:uncharacterized protein LOC141591684 n=1 Tax=Silene latifolia TaxID=37657 RepID=UPI003D76C4C7